MMHIPSVQFAVMSSTGPCSLQRSRYSGTPEGSSAAAITLGYM